MKGIIFTMLSEMIEEQFGYETWDSAILNTNPESKGIYVTTGTYADGELLGYVAELSRQTGIQEQELVFTFGSYMISKFKEVHPAFFTGHTARSFLKSIDSVVHVEVAKLHPEAVLPRFSYEDCEDGTLNINYVSPRNLCALAEGLIDGTGKLYGNPISVSHSQCVLKGSKACVFNLRFGKTRD